MILIRIFLLKCWKKLLIEVVQILVVLLQRVLFFFQRFVYLPRLVSILHQLLNFHNGSVEINTLLTYIITDYFFCLRLTLLICLLDYWSEFMIFVSFRHHFLTCFNDPVSLFYHNLFSKIYRFILPHFVKVDLFNTHKGTHHAVFKIKLLSFHNILFKVGMMESPQLQLSHCVN